MSRRCIHYRKPGTESDFVCGGHVRTFARPADGSDVSDHVWDVDCARCERSPLFKAAKAEAWEARQEANRKQEERTAKIAAAGFDTTKPMVEWTEEEVEAFLAWRASQKEEG